MRLANPLLATVLLSCSAAAATTNPLETMVVTARRVPATLGRTDMALTRIESGWITGNMHQHFSELAFNVPGAWISRGSGQEQLTAIRSPVLTGPGSCGAFLILEDGIPVRPAGFCNVNQAFEINTGQAHAVEVARGPAGSTWGANALHGTLNVLMDAPRDNAYMLGVGPDDFYRARLVQAVAGGTLLLNADHDGGFRAASGYDQGKINFFAGGDGLPRIRFAATRLQQETAGFVIGDEAWRDPALRLTNPNPEAFRDADAQRLSLSWSGSWPLTVYARHSRMTFLQHFLPGQPLERNGQRSIGFALGHALVAGQWSFRFGIDAEYARGWLRETQEAPAQGPDFLRETRPAGTHYDYQANSSLAALWLDTEHAIGEKFLLRLALRAETLAYRYDNRAADGNLRDDGSTCGFGGCLFNRPADRRDRYSNLAPRIALSGYPRDDFMWWLAASRGFRPPQATELYRLQRNQDVADVDSEAIDNIEAGLRLSRGPLALELAAYSSRKRNYILRDAEGFNVGDGRSLHHGIEAAFDLALHRRLSLQANLSSALHRYDFDRMAARGEIITTSTPIDTAPRRIASSKLTWRTENASELTLEWLHLGSYGMDAANSRRYPGHDLLNVYYSLALGSNWTLRARVANAADRRYADRADFAFGSERYFPGRGRSFYLDLHWQQ